MAGFDVVDPAAPTSAGSIGLVFQDPTLDEYLTAEENLRFHAELYGVPRETTEDRRIREVLEMVGSGSGARASSRPSPAG